MLSPERYASCPYNVVEKQIAKYENMERKVTEVMGGTVLNYGSKELPLLCSSEGHRQSSLCSRPAGIFWLRDQFAILSIPLKVTEVMGGTVLNYGSKELYLEAYKAGWEKGWKAGWEVGWEKGLKEWRIDLVTRKQVISDKSCRLFTSYVLMKDRIHF